MAKGLGFAIFEVNAKKLPAGSVAVAGLPALASMFHPGAGLR